MFGGFLNWERNVTGHTLSKNGIVIEMFDWLSLFMKFKLVLLIYSSSFALYKTKIISY